MELYQIVILAVIQGLAELLPVSSSAHVIVAEKLMGLDPSSPEMTFFLVMLHTGTMFAVLIYFWSRWRKLLSAQFIKAVVLATACTGVVGLSLKWIIEKAIELVVYGGAEGHPPGEIEHLFKNLPMIACALFCAGVLITWAGLREGNNKIPPQNTLGTRSTIWIGIVQGLCLPFRGFSRSGATISTGMLMGVNRMLAEEFSFALAVVVTPPVILLQLRRLYKATGSLTPATLTPGLIGMVFAFGAGLIALRWLSSWLEKGRWKYFGFYCFFASAGVATAAWMGL